MLPLIISALAVFVVKGAKFNKVKNKHLIRRFSPPSPQGAKRRSLFGCSLCSRGRLYTVTPIEVIPLHRIFDFVLTLRNIAVFCHSFMDSL